MTFIPHTDDERHEMLATIGCSMDELFDDIPAALRCTSFDVPAPKSEYDVSSHLGRLSVKNNTCLTGFMGGGFYDHFIPAVIDHVTRRSEFFTAYTPYQPEASQGTLQALYEFQSAICRLTGMDVANASMYDGGTAIYEAMMMALRLTRRNRVLVETGVNPIYRKMLRSYTTNLDIDFDEVPLVDGQLDRDAFKQLLDENTAAVVVQNPNFFGCLDELSDVVETAHANGTLVIMSCYPTSLGVLKTPGEMGVDIVTAEGQCLGLPLSFGGPYLGILAAREKHIRKMPGRIVGATDDMQGRRSFVLTLQAREQHIRREKAMSNICSNESLCAIAALAYLSLVGKQGLADLGNTIAAKTAYAQKKLLELDGVKLHYRAPVFNEFVIDLPIPAEEVIAKMIRRGIAPGFPLGRYYEGFDHSLLVAVTEKRTSRDIENLACTLEDILWS